MLNKDFYNKLDEGTQNVMEYLIQAFGQEEWFEEAWERYREHVLKTKHGIQPPGFVFNLYTFSTRR